MMRRRIALVAACVALLGAAAFRAPQPTVEDLKRALEVRLKALMPSRFGMRTVLFEEVTPAAPANGVYPFTVTAYVHDYGAGSPAKQEYGETCLRRMENWTFGLRADSAGGWKVEGRMTGADSVCMDNPADGESAIPLESLVSSGTSLEEDAGNLPAGEWACYDANGQPMASMSFVLKASGKYTDAAGARGGRFTYSGTRSEITFLGGFLSGQTGTDVQSSGFVLSPTVTCEPKK